MRRLLFLALAVICLAQVTSAQQSPQLLRDINTTPAPFGSYNMDPVGYVQMDGVTYYTAYTANLRRQLWRTDGSSSGTRMLTSDPSLNWRTNGSNQYEIPASIVPMNGNLYLFTAKEVSGGDNQFNLVRSDLSGNLTPLAVSDPLTSVHLTSLLSSSSNSTFGDAARQKMVVFGNHLYFAFSDYQHGIELWKSDGTAAGTAMLKDLTGDGTSSAPANFTVVGNTLYFTTSNTNSDFSFSLWKTDGTAAGTVRLKDDVATVAGVSSFTAINNTLYFLGYNSTTSIANLWKSDGTGGGTVSVAQELIYSLDDARLMKLGNSAVYMLGSGLKKYDGSTQTLLTTAVGTNRNFRRMNEWKEINGTLYFAGYNTGSFNPGLWKTDGTGAGTVAVKEGLTACNFLNAAGSLYFAGKDNSGAGTELWKSDGTAAGTVRISNFNTRLSLWSGDGIFDLSTDYPMVYQGGKVLLTAVNEVVTSTVPNSILAVSDGTPAGTDFLAPAEAENYGSFAAARKVWNGNLYFAAYQPATGYELWKTDGTTAGTVLLRDLVPGPVSSYVQAFTPYNGALYFLAADSTGGSWRNVLWRTDGTAAGTVKIKDSLGHGIRNASKMAVYDTTLFIIAGGGVYISDGSNAGTTRVSLLHPGAGEESSAANFAMLDSNNIIVCAAPGLTIFANNASQLWKVDRKLRTASRYSVGYMLATEMVSFDKSVYFSRINPAMNYVLWKTDGTAAGTVVADLTVDPHDLTVMNNGADLYYVGSDFPSTSLIKRIPAGGSAPVTISTWNDKKAAAFLYEYYYSYNLIVDMQSIYPLFYNEYRQDHPYFTKPAASGPIYMPSGNAATGIELFTTDGTAAGTSMVRDICADTFSAAPQFMTPFPDKNGDTLIAFVANDRIHGAEIWFSDGTSAGTRNYAQSIPGSNTLNPKYLTLLNGKLIFWGTAAASGMEPYVYELQQILKAGDPEQGNSVLQLYPNPAGQKLAVRCESAAKIEVYSLTGVKVLEATASGAATIIEVGSLVPGMYQVRVTTSSTRQTGRFVKL